MDIEICALLRQPAFVCHPFVEWNGAPLSPEVQHSVSDGKQFLTHQSAGIAQHVRGDRSGTRRVQSGGVLARVVQPGRLFAEVRIPQTQAQDVTVGQVAFIDTRNDTIEGRVRRIDPAVRNATITIDVALPDDLPPSARPDLTVDGTVVIDRLDDVVYMGRPAYGQANSTVGIFKLVDGGDYAERINVRLGLSSVNEIEIREGLQPGEVVILSDMSQWDGFDRFRLREKRWNDNERSPG